MVLEVQAQIIGTAHEVKLLRFTLFERMFYPYCRNVAVHSSSQMTINNLQFEFKPLSRKSTRECPQLYKTTASAVDKGQNDFDTPKVPAGAM
jgi:hypothetical protein